jgi:hypothetical protein
MTNTHDQVRKHFNESPKDLRMPYSGSLHQITHSKFDNTANKFVVGKKIMIISKEDEIIIDQG